MKASEAPEKIFLQEPTRVRTEKKYDNDVEYSRTDAFIEKASKWIEGLCSVCVVQDMRTSTLLNKENLIHQFKIAMN